jgi:hypothetical protein
LAAELDYRSCLRCGATTIMLTHWITGSTIEINPLPVRDGNIEVDFATGRCKVIPLKFIKNHPQLWQAHIASCPALKKEA